MADRSPHEEHLASVRTIATTLAALAGAAAVLAAREGAADWITAGMSVAGIAALGVALTVSVLEWRAVRGRGVSAATSPWRRRRVVMGGAVVFVLVAVVAAWASSHDREPGDVPFDRLRGAGPYRVNGTCWNHTCVLYERREPSIESTKVARLREGQALTIACQTRGQLLVGPNGVSSGIWDRLRDAHSGPYVSDYFTDTPGVGRFTRGIPRC